MFSRLWTDRLLKIPGARQVKNHLEGQGHTVYEAEMGGVFFSGLVIFLMVILFDTFLYGVIRTFFNQFFQYCADNPIEATGIGIFSTVLFLAVVFQTLRKSSVQKAEKEMAHRMMRHKIDEKREFLRRGAMGNFEEVFRFQLEEKYPDVAIKTIHVVDAVPRIRFQVQRFNTEMGGEVNKNYQLFRDNLFGDTLHIIETAFAQSENIPFVIVDALMNFINRKAEYYDGVVMSVKAQKEVYNRIDKVKSPPFKILTSFDLRYNDGMEVEAMPQEESKNARIIEKIKENAPKLHVRYEEAKTKVDDGWEKPPVVEDTTPFQETIKGKELSSMPLAQFQDMVVGLMEKMSFQVQAVKKVPGGTIQVLADYQHPVIGGNYMILARQYPETAPVHADLVRELDGLAREESCKRGIYVVTGRFTEEAKNISRKMAVDLVDFTKLFQLLEGPAYDGRWTFRMVDEKGVVNDLSRMTLINFQEEVSLFLKSMGFRVEKSRRAIGGAIVVVAEHPHPITGGKFTVMAKQFPEGERVPAELVSELGHIMTAEFCYRGLLMVTADFAPDARALSRFSNVDLVDRTIWDNLRRHL